MWPAIVQLDGSEVSSVNAPCQEMRSVYTNAWKACFVPAHHQLGHCTANKYMVVQIGHEDQQSMLMRLVLMACCVQLLYEHSYLETPANQKDAVAYTKWAAQILIAFNPMVVDDTTLYFDGFISQTLPLYDADTNLIGKFPFMFSAATPIKGVLPHKARLLIALFG